MFIQRIITYSVRNKVITGLFVVALILYGVYDLQHLPIDAVPDITENQVQIITQAPSYSATDIERLITFPVEQVCANIPGLSYQRSFSRFGLSLITLVFEDGIQIQQARQLVNERLQGVISSLPLNIGKPEMGPVTTGLGEIYQYVVRPKKGFEKRYSLTELRTIQDWIIRRQLLTVKGVADVSSFGGRLRQIEIAPDPGLLKSYNISLHELISAVERNNANAGGAYIERGPNVFFIHTEGLLESIDQIKQIPVKYSEGGHPVLMSDIAQIKEGSAVRYGSLLYNDHGEASGAIVMMLKGANSNEVIERIKEKVEEIRLTLPEGIEMESFLDRTKMVNHAINTVTTNLAEGALIVIFVLVIFLGNIRAGLIVASVIPLSMLFAVIMMNLFGVSGNLMSLGALDFGLIVDGAVIIVEAVLHRFHLKTGENKDELVIHESGRMMQSAFYGQLIILVVYLPIFALGGIEGKMFIPMAQTVTFALLGAFILSVTYIPLISTLAFSERTHGSAGINKFFERVKKVYINSFLWVYKFRVINISVTVILFIISIVIFSQMGGEFIPELEEGDFAIETRVLTGSNLTITQEACTRASKILLQEFPEVEKVVTKIGSGEIPTDPMPMEASDLMVIMKDKKEWKQAKTFDGMAELMKEKLSAIPGVSFGFQYPVQMRFNELMTGARQDVVVKLFGDNLDTLTHLGERISHWVGKTEGAADLYVEQVSGLPQIYIRCNREVMARYNISVDDINEAVQIAYGGHTAGKIYEGDRRFDIVIRLDESTRTQTNSIEQLLINSTTGQPVPLGSLAQIKIMEGPNQIQRENGARRLMIGFNVRGKDVKSVVEELKGKIRSNLKIPAGYYIKYGGSFENLEKASKRLSIAVPVALVLIFIILFLAFESIKYGILIFSAVPLSAIGGVLFLVIRGIPFSVSAGIGFIALFGVAVLNGVVMMAEFTKTKKLNSEIEDNFIQKTIHASSMRLRPVLMTAAVASLGFLPMAFSNGAGAEVQRPLATVVIGGLITSTVLTLYILPLLYILTNKKNDYAS